MNPTLMVLIVALLAITSVCVWRAYRKRTKAVNAANAANPPNQGRHVTGRTTMLADAAIHRWAVVKIGSDAYHVAESASATDTPFGIAEDEAEAAEDPVTVALIPGCVGTTFMVASAVIAQGALVQSNGDYRVKTAVSTGYAIGRALQAAGAAGDVIEVAILYTGVALA